MNNNLKVVLLFLILTPGSVILSKHLFNPSDVTSSTADKVVNGNYDSFGINSENPINIYTVEWCKACSRLKKYLRVKGVPFKNMDVEKSSEALAHYKKLEGDRYPLILFSNVRINGFHKLELDNQLQKLLQQPKS